MHADHDERRGESAIVGELARIVDTYRDPPDTDDGRWWDDQAGLLAVETVVRDPDLDTEIMEGVRARRLPFLAAGAVGLAGWGAHGYAEIMAGSGGDTRQVVVLGTCVASTAAVGLLRLRFRHSIPDTWRRRWWLVAACGAGWVNAAVIYGPDSWAMTGALIVGSAALAGRWWAEWEVPGPGEGDPPPDPEPVQIEPTRAAQIEQAWADASTAGRGAVPRGALLTGRTDLPGGGLRYTVQLDPAAGVGATALSARAADVALVLRMSTGEVILEVGGSEDLAVLSVVPQGQAALAAGVPYSGPQYRDGRVPVALDITGRVREWIAHERGQGVSSGLTVGDMRSGKTAALELLALGLRKSGVWRVWYGDGDSAGASSNLLGDTGVAHWPERTPDGLLRQLDAFEALLESRAHQKNLLTEDPTTGLPVPRRSGQPAINEFPPCPDFPGYMWIIPELFQAVTNEQLKAAGFADRLDRLLRRAPKFGLGVAADTQSALGSDFGRSTQLRAWLSRVNAFVMRTTNRSDQYAINGLTLGSGTLPRGGGWGLAAGQDGAGIMLRTMWQPDLHRWVPTLPDCADDPEAATAIAPFLPDVDDDPEASLAEYRAALDRWRDGARTGATPAVEVPRPPVSVGGVSVPTPLGARVIPVRPNGPTGESSAGERQRPSRVRPLDSFGPISANPARVLDVLRSRPGQWAAGDLADETGLSASSVSKALGPLRDRGLARSVRFGVWEAIDSAATG